MKIVLLGGGGFIGEYLARLLLKRKDCQVFIADRGASLKSKSYKDAEIIVIMTQPDQKVIRDAVYLISSSKVLKKILYLSTLLLYPDSDYKQNEDFAVEPKTTYEKDKYQEEILLSRVIKNSECKLCIARMSNVYGDIKNKGIINYILLSLIEKKNLVINGNPKLKIRDYIFVEDAVNILEFLIFYIQKSPEEIFNICTAQGISLEQLIDKIEALTEKKTSYKIGENIPEKKVNIGNNSKVLKLSGYQFKYSLLEGLNKTYKNYLKHYLV